MKVHSKAILVLTASLAVAIGLFVPLQGAAQGVQPPSATPQLPAGFKVVLNNEHVRVFESTFAPGVVVPMNNYPKRTTYVLKGSSQMAYSYADGKTETLTQQTGAVSSRERERMSVTNVGTSEVVVLVVIDKRDIPQPQ